HDDPPRRADADRAGNGLSRRRPATADPRRAGPRRRRPPLPDRRPHGGVAGPFDLHLSGRHRGARHYPPVPMATVALRRPAALERSIAGIRVLEYAGLAALVAVSLVLRTGQMHVHFWIDEGLSVGISRHAITDIPGVLRLDGSPPLYYWLLHWWMEVFGRSEAQTHAFSLLCAMLTIPAAWWAGRSLFGERTGWALAGLTAINPFLTSYAQETRMYALVILL